jgi:hypothetical protein
MRPIVRCLVFVVMAAPTTVASAATTATPRACVLLTKAVVASLIKEQAKTLIDQPLVCSYGRRAERAATLRTTVGLLLVRNPSVAAARKVHRATENAAPKQAAGAAARFAREKVRAPGADEAFFVYFYLPGKAGRSTSASGLAFVRVGAVTAQLTLDVYSKGAPVFTAAELRKGVTSVIANWSQGG